MERKEQFNDDLNHTSKTTKEEGLDAPNKNDLATKWNEIQDEYIAKYKQLDTVDLYFEGGGFNGMLNRISEILNKPVDDIRQEIANW